MVRSAGIRSAALRPDEHFDRERSVLLGGPLLCLIRIGRPGVAVARWNRLLTLRARCGSDRMAIKVLS